MKSRTASSARNALAAIGLTLANGIGGVVSTHFILTAFGSDFNGVNSTANHIANFLMIFEGGFALVSNVALLHPLAEGDVKKVACILEATRRNFRCIGGIFAFVGGIAALLYGTFVNSSLPWEFVTSIVFMAILPQIFNFFFVICYRVLLQADQKEYILSIISMCTVSLGHIGNILVVYMHGPMWMIRFIVMIFSVINGIIVILLSKRMYPLLKEFHEPVEHDGMLKGTQDVVIQRITGTIYNTAPMIFLSIASGGGTKLASVYAVYNSVFLMMKGILYGVISAPRFAIGDIFMHRDSESAWAAFKKYEFVSFLCLAVFLSTTCAALLPFIDLYTANVKDIEYHNLYIAIFMATIALMEAVHIPSGHLINMAGEFKISRNIQLTGTICLLTCFAIFGFEMNIYQMMSAILFTAAGLSVLEIGYVHTRLFRGKLVDFFQIAIPVLGMTILLSCVEFSVFSVQIANWGSLIAYSSMVFLLHCTIVIATGMIFNKNLIGSIYMQCTRSLPSIFANKK